MNDVNDVKMVNDVNDECRSNGERLTNLGNVFFTATVCVLVCTYNIRWVGFKTPYTVYVKKNATLIKKLVHRFLGKKCATLLWFGSGFVEEVYCGAFCQMH